MDEKEAKKILENFYDKDGHVSEFGIEHIKGQYKLAAELEVRLIELVNEYVGVMDNNIFGFIWDRITKSIVMKHNIDQLIGDKPDGMEVK